MEGARVASRIRAEMLFYGLTGKDMSRLFNISTRSWSNWMKDPESYLTLGRMEVIAAKLKLSLPELLEEAK